MSFHRLLQRREYGLPSKIGDRDLIMKRIYSSIEPYHQWNNSSDMPGQTSEFGAVFNLEFSPEGNVLVAACEKKSILLFDAISTKQNHQVTNAHTDNVNCIKFLDDRMFATCSDDTTVALWDLRYLKNKVRSLHGHSNWVKNIEYSHKDSLLVTSGFDGSIFTWDINSHTEQGLIYQKVFNTSGLMRCRITPDGTKLVICTTGGYLMIIHDLDLTTLHKDLCGFRPSMYRLMQMGHQHIPQAAKFDHVFSKKQKKNRVELVTDFPTDNDAEVILALQIHPHGHSFLSRNISYDELTEWSCIHDINEEPGDITEQLKDDGSVARKRKLLTENDDEPSLGNRRLRDSLNGADSAEDSRIVYGVSRRHRRHRRLIGRAPPPPPPPSNSTTRNGGNNESGSSSTSPANTAPSQQSSIRPEAFVPDIWAAEVTLQERAIRQNRGRSYNSVTGYNFVYAISSGVLPVAAIRQPANAPGSVTRRSTSATTTNDERPSSPTLNTSTDGASTSSDSSPLALYEQFRVHSLISPLTHSREKIIFQNAKKLMYYMKESNAGKGFIKEPSFSSDGRVVCSPYDNGVRLLTFADDCSEYPRHRSENIKGNPKNLIELKYIKSHSDIVLCTKFSPREPLLVTGCRSGTVAWHHPNL